MEFEEVQKSGKVFKKVSGAAVLGLCDEVKLSRVRGGREEWEGVVLGLCGERKLSGVRGGGEEWEGV